MAKKELTVAVGDVVRFCESRSEVYIGPVTNVFPKVFTFTDQYGRVRSATKNALYISKGRDGSCEVISRAADAGPVGVEWD